MFEFLKLLILTCIPTKQSQKNLSIEILVLRQQLAVLKQEKPRPKLKNGDRLFWVALSRMWPHWKNSLIIVKPETVIGWHRKGFKLFWRIKSQRGRGRPKISKEIRDLIKQISLENPIWGSPHIEGELLKLGYTVRKSTIEKYMVKSLKPPSQNWQTFLRNHAKDIVACDFFTVPTITFRSLHVLLFISHARRKIVHFSVSSECPSSHWAAQQLTNAFPYDSAPKFIIHDRDPKFQGTFQSRCKAMNIRRIVTARKAPLMNSKCERMIGSIRRECLNHCVILNEKHLHRILKEYFDYYHKNRTHQSLDNDCPETRAVDPPENGPVQSTLVLGGLHHRYFRKVA
jgi:putative transposase